jgi:hypothetical protein
MLLRLEWESSGAKIRDTSTRLKAALYLVFGTLQPWFSSLAGATDVAILHTLVTPVSLATISYRTLGGPRAKTASALH